MLRTGPLARYLFSDRKFKIHNNYLIPIYKVTRDTRLNLKKASDVEINFLNSVAGTEKVFDYFLKGFVSQKDTDQPWTVQRIEEVRITWKKLSLEAKLKYFEQVAFKENPNSKDENPNTTFYKLPERSSRNAQELYEKLMRKAKKQEYPKWEELDKQVQDFYYRKLRSKQRHYHTELQKFSARHSITFGYLQHLMEEYRKTEQSMTYTQRENKKQRSQQSQIRAKKAAKNQ